MDDDKKRNILNIVFSIIIVAIVTLLIYFGYNYAQVFLSSKEAADFVDDFEKRVGETEPKADEEKNNSGENSSDADNENGAINEKNNSAITYSNEQYTVLGTMSIPKINFKYPILQEQSQEALNKAVVVLYGVGLNKPGNTVVIGHNYMNGKLFSNNKKLEVGDQIFVTDNLGKKLTYTIYNKFEADPDDASFYVRDTNGVAELTLSTCTDNSQKRIIILAKAQ
ncbi:MAG: sortase [Clostridia bacterium]|nr:sortase [Clostridia bacterium]